MKTKIFLTLSLLFAFLTLSAQQRLTEKDVMKNSHIDFSKQYISFVLSGLIEIDGHVFLNDTCKSPIKYRATLDKVIIIDTVCGNEYEHRVCNKPGCKIIHLTETQRIATFSNWGSVNTLGTLRMMGNSILLDARADTLRTILH